MSKRERESFIVGADMISFIDSTGHERFLGNNPAPVRYSWQTYGDSPVCPLVPKSEWKDIIGDNTNSEYAFLPPVADQDGIGSCNACATTTSMESCRLQMGLPYVQLSAADLYGRINGGYDRGSTLEDGIREALNGVCTTKEVGYLEWRKRATSEVLEVRKKYKLLEAFLCPTFEHCMSAVLKGFSLISGIMWYDNFTPDKDGWLPRPRGRSGGHAIYGYKGTYRGNDYGIWHQNSWSERYGLKGRFVIPEFCYSGPVGGWWAVRSVTREEADLPVPDFKG